VATRLYDNVGHELTRAMLVELDRWVMQEILEPTAIA